MKKSIVLLVMVVLTAVLTAQPVNDFNTNEIANLSAGINSDNHGLKRSSIYFAGQYKVVEVIEDLKKELKQSNDPSIKVLAALALYEIGDESVVEDLMNIALNQNEDLKVRKITKAIYDNWVTKISVNSDPVTY